MKSHLISAIFLLGACAPRYLCEVHALNKTTDPITEVRRADESADAFGRNLLNRPLELDESSRYTEGAADNTPWEMSLGTTRWQITYASGKQVVETLYCEPNDDWLKSIPDSGDYPHTALTYDGG